MVDLVQHQITSLLSELQSGEYLRARRGQDPDTGSKPDCSHDDKVLRNVPESFRGIGIILECCKMKMVL